MFSEENAASFGIFILHQFRDQPGSQYPILHRDPFEYTASRIKGGITQFFRIHLTQSFETLKLQSLRIRVGPDKLLSRVIVKQPVYLPLVLDRVERRAGDI